MAHGLWLVHIKAVPPDSQPFLAAILARGLSFLSQLLTGELTEALLDHPHDGLQQSQYLVVFPVDWALIRAVPITKAITVSRCRESMMCKLVVILISEDCWCWRWWPCVLNLNLYGPEGPQAAKIFNFESPRWVYEVCPSWSANVILLFASTQIRLTASADDAPQISFGIT